jgi:hypothetical protein
MPWSQKGALNTGKLKMQVPYIGVSLYLIYLQYWLLIMTKYPVLIEIKMHPQPGSIEPSVQHYTF